MSSWVRWPFWWFYKVTGRGAAVMMRLSKEIGPTGYGDGMKGLSRFQRWLWGPVVESETKRRHECFRGACLEVLGEDPDDWGKVEP